MLLSPAAKRLPILLLRTTACGPHAEIQDIADSCGKRYKSVESYYRTLGRDVGTDLAPSRPRGRARGLGHWNASALKLPLDTLLTATLLSKVEAGGLDTHSIKLAAKQKDSPSDGMNGPVAPPICGRRAIVETAARELLQSTTESSLRLLRGRYPAARFPFADAVLCTRYMQV